MTHPRGRTSMRLVASAIAMLLLAQVPEVAAQANERADLSAGLTIGWRGGHQLWEVAQQPIASDYGYPPDQFHLSRAISQGYVVTAGATWFRGDHVGFTGEFAYLGLKTSSSCYIAVHYGDPGLPPLCDRIQADRSSRAVTALNVGAVWRTGTHGALQPYAKALIGVASAPTNTAAVSVTGLTLYVDRGWSAVRPTWALAGGVTTAPVHSIQVRLEFREIWMKEALVTGAVTQGSVPPTRFAVIGWPTVMAGVEIALRRSHGKRY